MHRYALTRYTAREILWGARLEYISQNLTDRLPCFGRGRRRRALRRMQCLSFCVHLVENELKIEKVDLDLKHAFSSTQRQIRTASNHQVSDGLCMQKRAGDTHRPALPECVF